jgi:hypothetical protein
MPKPELPRRYPWWINLLLGSVVVILGAAILALFARPATAGFRPAVVRSQLLADYSADPHDTPFAALDLRIVQEALRDQQPVATGTATPTLVPIQALLETPVIQVTVAPGRPTPTAPPTASPVPTDTPAPTASPAMTDTEMPSPTPTVEVATETPLPTQPPTAIPPTRAPIPTRLILPTATVVIVPTQLATPTNALPMDTPPAPADTDTPILPTDPPPADTDVPAPTETAEPPPPPDTPEPYQPPPTDPPPGYP